ncbi:hypothetical protein [Thioalkalivibrio sp. XN8]|uniref:hypothetical protein n=1 Tax=Thioalkalivibrio sp. XN8 TaxID=2712863 RepID=UPI0013EC18FF|nr:hypothetical protein [Thioalkalivibrio sp. XN8]NGP53581.1 hypothetical protein [Thioalkalivibrio sp. XN8]
MSFRYGVAFGAALVCSLVAWNQATNAQPAGYTTLNVKNRVQLEVPGTWSISDAEQRLRVKELAEQQTGIAATHMAALSVQSYPAPSRVIVRVSITPVDPPVSQAELQRELEADRRGVLNGLAEAWREMAPTMWTGMEKQGISEVGQSSVTAEMLGGQLALVIRYARTSTVDPLEVVRVSQYHVLLGSEKALITLSYVDGDQAARDAHDRVKKSFMIR